MESRIKIVADSSADLLTLSSLPFANAPLKIVTSEKEYTDNENLDVFGMVTDLQNYSGKSSTSCPNASDWLNAFGDAKEVFCITITATLSGSYNAAMLAKKMYEDNDPSHKVFVLNSLSTGPEMALIVERFEELYALGKDFDTICKEVQEYAASTGLLFMLESLKNLANNGRVSPIVAKMAGFLGIRLVGKASDVGDLQPLDKCRGEKKALATFFTRLKELGYSGGKVRISHCFNEKVAAELEKLIKSEFANADVKIYLTRGLCSFYAEEGGMLVGFEKGKM